MTIDVSHMFDIKIGTRSRRWNEEEGEMLSKLFDCI